MLKIVMSLAFISTPLGMARAETARAPANRARLGELVRQECGSCHGLTLGGGLGRPLTVEALERLPVDAVRDVILDGLPGTPMPPWRPLLTSEEAEMIARILKSGETP
jgi:cytochrome c55X